MVNGQLVVSEKKKEERRQLRDDAPVGAERGGITLEGRETIPESTAACLNAALLNAVTEKGPYGFVMGWSGSCEASRPCVSYYPQSVSYLS